MTNVRGMENKLFLLIFLWFINSTYKINVLISACPSNCLSCDTDHSKCDTDKCDSGYYKTDTGACAGKSFKCSFVLSARLSCFIIYM